MLYCSDCIWMNDDESCAWNKHNPASCGSRLSKSEYDERVESWQAGIGLVDQSPEERARDAEWKRKHPGGPLDAYGPYHQTRLALGTVIVDNDEAVTATPWQRIKAFIRRMF